MSLKVISYICRVTIPSTNIRCTCRGHVLKNSVILVLVPASSGCVFLISSTQSSELDRWIAANLGSLVYEYKPSVKR